jgi:hypothetical protein
VLFRSERGRATDVAVVNSAIHDDATERCLTRMIASHPFPAEMAGVDVSYPFVFSPFAPES